MLSDYLLYKQHLEREFLATTRLKSYEEGDEENSTDVYDIGVVSTAPAYERQPQLMEQGLYKPEPRYDGVGTVLDIIHIK